jgi:hypothetical protein
MKTIYLVKSFGDEGCINLKAFSTELEAEKFAVKIKKQIPLEVLASGEESVEIEELELMEES